MHTAHCTHIAGGTLHHAHCTLHTYSWRYITSCTYTAHCTLHTVLIHTVLIHTVHPSYNFTLLLEVLEEFVEDRPIVEERPIQVQCSGSAPTHHTILIIH
jgi:hypothetical protein